MTLTHYFAWKNNPKRAEWYKRPCRIVARGTMNSVQIEFASGQREVVSRFAVKRRFEKGADDAPMP